MKPCFVRIDNTTVRLLYKEHVSVNTIDLATPRGIGDVVAVPTRKGFEIGGSILTDGTQVLTTCAKRWSQTDFVSSKQFAKHVEMQQKRATRIAAYEKQQARRSSGEAAEGDVERIHWKSVAPSYKTDTTHIQPREGPFHACTHGFFDRTSAHATHQAGGALPTVFGLDPGVKNLWNIVQYDEAASRTPSEAKRVLNLGRAEYNHSTKYNAFKGWLEKAASKPAYAAANEVLTRNSLKVMGLALFEARYRETRRAFEVLQSLYGSRTFAKRRFLYARRKQSYEDRLVQKTAKKMAAMAGGDDFVVAYGDGDFPVVIKGLGSSSHKKLMRLLSKKVRIVLTREYRSTKACP